MRLLKHALRQLVLRPGLAAIMIAMLALGIGASTAIFSLFYQVLVRPLPVPTPERLVNLVATGPAPQMRRGRPSFSYPMFRDLESEQTSFTGLAATVPFGANLATRGQGVNVQGAFVSGSYFGVLGLSPAAGRLIGPEDEPQIGESPVVVLSYDFWQDRYGGDPSLIGRTLTISGQPLTVVGVAPARFAGTQLGVRTQVFAPLTIRDRLLPFAGPDLFNARNFTWVPVFARLRPGTSLEQAAASLNVLYGRLLRDVEAPQRSMPEQERAQFLAGGIELRSGARGQGSIEGASRSLPLLLGVTLLVLLIVCVNIANLLLVRGASRGGEMAVRQSMGASRGRLVAELLAETAVPVLIGGALAFPVATAMLAAVAPVLPMRLADGLGLELGPAAIGFAVLASLASGLLFGVFPALRATSVSPALAIKGQSAQTLGGNAVRRVRGALVTAQIALSTVLLVLAGLFAESLWNVAHIDLGMGIDSILTFNVSPRLSGYDAKRALTLYDEIERALVAQPGVASVSSAAVPVIAGGGFELTLGIEAPGGGWKQAQGSLNHVDLAFFRTLGIPLLAGRDFTAADKAGSPRVAIVNERFARESGLGMDALGKHLRYGDGPDETREIVGIAADSAYENVKDDAPPQLFFTRDDPSSFLVASATFYVRSAIDPDALLPSIPRIVASIDPTLPVEHLVTLRRQARENVFVDRLVTLLCASFAGLATLLAAIGLYGVMAYNVATRIRELGLRLALGAEPHDLRSMVLRQVAVLTSIGLAVGLVAAIGLGRAARALLFGVSGNDPLVLAGVMALLAVVVFAASYWPARRASTIAPMEALRHE